MSGKESILERKEANNGKEIIANPTEGVEFATGKPVTFKATHRKQPHVDFGTRFGQHVEPHGQYIVHGHHGEEGEHEEPSLGEKPFIVTTQHSTRTFENPLVLPHGGYGPEGWKQRLSDKFGGKTGKDLSQALIEAGHDGIVTIDTGARGKQQVSEIVDLKPSKPAGPQEGVSKDHDPIIHHSDVFLKLIEETLIKELNETATATAMGAGAVEVGASPFAAVVRRRPAKKIEEEELDEEIDEETQITEDEDEVISEVLNYLLQMSGEQ